MENQLIKIVKLGERNEVVLLEDELERLGVKAGDLITIRIERYEEFPYTDEPIGPQTRAGIEAGLRELREGKGYGPFDTAEEAIAHLNRDRSEDRE
jgi:hypothetical protein